LHEDKDQESMKIVADMSLYPLKEGPIPTIIEFINESQEQEGIEIVTNAVISAGAMTVQRRRCHGY
jgi:hypothetical protein